MKFQRTSVGLDVHARSIVACGLDGDTGEVFERRLCPDHREVLEWITRLPAGWSWPVEPQMWEAP